MSYNTANYREQGGAKDVIGRRGEQHLEGKRTYGANSHQGADSVTLTPAAGSTNVCKVTIQATDFAGNTVAAVCPLRIYLSDSSIGAGLTGTSASGAVAAGSAGTDLATVSSKKCLDVVTNASGVYELSITDSAKTGFYPVVVLSTLGRIVVGSQLQTANYG